MTTTFRARRPRTLGDASDFADLPTTASGAIDFSNMTVGPTPDFTIQAPKTIDFASLASDVVKGAQTYYGAQAQVNAADYSARLAKAQAQAALNIAKAGGQNAARTAGAGLPSPTLLLIAGLGLAAVLVMRR